jgi:hypothetical protein
MLNKQMVNAVLFQHTAFLSKKLGLQYQLLRYKYFKYNDLYLCLSNNIGIFMILSIYGMIDALFV